MTSRQLNQWRRSGCVLLTVLFAVAACASLPTIGPLVAASSVISLTAALSCTLWPGPSANTITAAVTATCAASLTVTAAFRGPVPPEVGNWWALETVAFLVLAVPAARQPRPRPAAGAALLLCATVALLPLRICLYTGPPAEPAETARLCLIWALLGAAAAGTGCYLRSLDARTALAVAAERQAQRLSLAMDLHDFAAHDLTSVITLAQAARVLARKDPARAVELMPEIESASGRALAALDRTVHLFADRDSTRGPAQHPAGAGHHLGELPVLVARFARVSGTDTRLELPEGLAEGLHPEVGHTGYRIVVEALTNIRRHAATATTVVVAVSPAPCGAAPGVRIQVTDNASDSLPRAAGDDREACGLGLPGLADRVGALGGTFAAGPARSAGWRLDAVLPLAPTPPPSAKDRPIGR
jgi:signal transduction histidine kinase